MKRKQHFLEEDPILYLVATPIGNLQEFSSRAIETLQSCDYIGCEDTRTSGTLFQKFAIHASLVSCHEHNENDASDTLIHHLLEGKKVAYVSDAGYPGISDPGHRLVKKALENDISVSVISGSCAFLPALIGSGLDCDHFYFHGFLASKESARKNELQELRTRKETLIFYESPHRIHTTLENMLSVFENRKACIARELTKIHEEYIRGSLEELCNIDPKTLKGEMVLIVEGNQKEQEAILGDEEIIRYVKSLTDMGVSTKDAIQNAARSLNISKNYVYQLIHREKGA